MYDDKKIIKAKLRFQGSQETVHRRRLLSLLTHMQTKALTLVTAGAGYGKTTLMGQAVNHFGHDAVWYRLDRYDADFYRFMTYLKSGVEDYLGKIDFNLHPKLTDKEKYEHVLTVFLTEIENCIQKDLYIVLDDYHLIHENREINRAVEFLIDNLHPQAHLIIISRAEPPFKLSRLRARRAVLDITENELAFTSDEIERLYQELFNLALEDNQLIRILKEKTGGWVSGLVLFYHTLERKNRDEVKENLFRLRGSHNILSTYLEENVYELLSAGVKEFLVKTALFSRIKVHQSDQLLSITNSKQILDELAKKHLFTFRLNDVDESFGYHHLFQDFLIDKLKEKYTEEEIRQLKIKLAELLEQDGDDEEALGYFLESEEMASSCRLIGKIGTELWLKGRLDLYKSYIGRIPPRYFKEEPWIKYFMAQMLDLAGNTQESMQCLLQAQAAFAKNGIIHGEELCMQRLAYQNFMAGNLKKAACMYQQLLDRPVSELESRMLSYSIYIMIEALRGNFPEADRLYTEAIDLFTTIFEKTNEWHMILKGLLFISRSTRFFCSGDLNNSLENIIVAQDFITPSDFFALHTMLDFSLARIYFYMGRFEEGGALSLRGLELMNVKGFDDFFPSIWLNMTAAQHYLAMEKYPEAETYAVTSLSNAKRCESFWGQAAGNILLAKIHRQNGNIQTSEECIGKCERILYEIDMPMIQAELDEFQISILLANGEMEEAYRILNATVGKYRKYKHLEHRLTLLWAILFWKQGNKNKAFSGLQQAFQKCREYQYDIPLDNEWKELIPMLTALYAKGEEQSRIQTIFKQAGLDVRQLLIDFEIKPDQRSSKQILEIVSRLPVRPLQIQCFGEFKLFKGNEEITASDWSSQKAKLMFKFLLMQRKHGFTPKDVLIEILWPDQDARKTANRLRVILSYLRKILEPELIKGMVSSYILTDIDGYKLSVGEGGSIDIDQFEYHFQQAEAFKKDPAVSIQHYLKAEKLYNGHLFEEDLYEDWIAEERDRYREIYLKVIANTMRYYEGLNDLQASIEYAWRYLDVDPYSENTYMALMTYYAKQGDKAMISRVYEKSKEKLENDLGCPLSSETENAYQVLRVRK